MKNRKSIFLIVDKLIMVCYDIANQDQKSKIGLSSSLAILKSI